MSIVISFRLNPENPRDEQALNILRKRQAEGFSTRRILTDALLDLDNPRREVGLYPVDEFDSALIQVRSLLERFNEGEIDKNSVMPNQFTALNSNFLNSVKISAKPGLNLD